mmetsp:Transcript_10889/g.18441  ORF Transcript_10889/g.18441 Transcript_10889/m.18441 type:complete len:86 (-) Transcript_10889:1407-1664(-)
MSSESYRCQVNKLLLRVFFHIIQSVRTFDWALQQTNNTHTRSTPLHSLPYPPIQMRSDWTSTAASFLHLQTHSKLVARSLHVHAG